MQRRPTARRRRHRRVQRPLYEFDPEMKELESAYEQNAANRNKCNKSKTDKRIIYTVAIQNDLNAKKSVPCGKRGIKKKNKRTAKVGQKSHGDVEVKSEIDDTRGKCKIDVSAND